MEIYSVGIDIGTTTTQLILSRLTIENEASAFTVPRVRIRKKEIVYRGAVHFTPFRTAEDIDGDAVHQLVTREFAAAGVSPDEVATGAVIITGEAARKSNADLVLEKLRAVAGQFVVSTAGPDLESIIAGKGSGAFQHAKTHHCCSVNVDIGGGTANLAAFRDGSVLGCGCLDIGGRQVRVDEAGRIAYISPSADAIAAAHGLRFAVGERADAAQLSLLTDAMAALLLQVVAGQAPALAETVRTKGSSPYQAPPEPQAIFLSGGVADCVFAEKTADFAYGDIGNLLGRSIRNSPLFRQMDIHCSAETLRATVIGAGVHLVSVSGSTISLSPGLLPIRDLPVLKLDETAVAALRPADAAELAARVAWFRAATQSERVAVAFTGARHPGYAEITRLADVFHAVLEQPALREMLPVLLIENDMAKALGQALRIRFQGRRELICIDGVAVQDGDYVDLGAPLLGGLAIPVVVKTLIIG